MTVPASHRRAVMSAHLRRHLDEQALLQPLLDRIGPGVGQSVTVRGQFEGRLVTPSGVVINHAGDDVLRIPQLAPVTLQPQTVEAGAAQWRPPPELGDPVLRARALSSLGRPHADRPVPPGSRPPSSCNSRTSTAGSSEIVRRPDNRPASGERTAR